MGIINITDNSFYSGSRYLGKDGRPDMERIVSGIRKMLEDGASIIDFGACSTHPGAVPVGADEEWRRLAPVLETVWATFPGITVSIDTWWSSVVTRAAALFKECTGASSSDSLIINDISAGEDDPEMLPAVGELGLTYIAMHKRGTSADMQEKCDYENVTDEVIRYFEEFASKAEDAGIMDWILDPGFGFAKTLEQNYRLLHDLDRFREIRFPGTCASPRILVGVSRKSMIYRLAGITPEESLAQTQVLHLAALERGADILRVHDVAEAVRTVRTFRMLCPDEI